MNINDGLNEAGKFYTRASAPTPGPWVVSKWTSVKPNPGEKGISILCAGGVDKGLELARILPTHDDNGEANAALIAAAPELLTALKDALAYASGEATNFDLIELGERCEKLIAKAEGK